MNIGTHRILTVSEVSEFLKVHPSTIYRLLRENVIPAFRVASEWRFNFEEVEKWTQRMSRLNSTREGEGKGASDGRPQSAAPDATAWPLRTSPTVGV